MNSKHKAMDRLIVRGRQAMAAVAWSDHDVQPPPGFATRIAALARRRSEEVWWSVIEQRGWRMLGGAVAIAALAVAINFRPVFKSIEDDVLAADDPMLVVLDLS